MRQTDKKIDLDWLEFDNFVNEVINYLKDTLFK